MFCQSNDFFYSCHRISKLSYLFNIGLWLQLWEGSWYHLKRLSIIKPLFSIKHVHLNKHFCCKLTSVALQIVLTLHWCPLYSMTIKKCAVPSKNSLIRRMCSLADLKASDFYLFPTKLKYFHYFQFVGAVKNFKQLGL
jgi:hypothetical protein